MMATLTFLGTGTSQGVPVIGCTCAVCTSSDTRDQRLRSSAWVQTPHGDLVIDTGPDFRQQMLQHRVQQVDAVLLTHQHRDHTGGLDDIRPFNFRSGGDMPLYATDDVHAYLRQAFAYMFMDYPGLPRIQPVHIQPSMAFQPLPGCEVMPIQVMHGNLPILGFRMGSLAYITDALYLADKELEKLADLEILIINALQIRPHYSHLNLQQALDLIYRVGPKRAYLTHISHHLGLHDTVIPMLPPHVLPAHDGLSLSFRW